MGFTGHWRSFGSVALGNIGQRDRSVGSDLQLFPVPANGSVTLSLTVENVTEMTTRIMDMSGRVVRKLGVLTASTGSNQMALELAGLQAGRYVIELSSNSGLSRLPVQIAE